MSRSGFRAAACGIVLAGAVLRFWALDLGLPHLMARPDDESVLSMTERPARGHMDVGWAVYPSAYIYLCWLWGTAAVHVGQALDAVPPGDYVSLLYTHPDRVLLVERVLTATLGTATVAVVIAVARPALGEAAALAAGVLLATSLLHARDSHSLKPDVALAFLSVVALGVMAPLAVRTSIRRGVLAGAVAGLAMGMKYPGVLLLVPLWVGAVVGSDARRLRRLVPASAVTGGIAAATVFVATSPFLLTNEETRSFLVYIVHLAFPQLGQPTGPVSRLPAQHVEWWRAFVYHATFSLRWGIGLLPTLLAPIALLWAFVDRRPLVLVSAVFALVYYLVMGASPTLLARYVTPVVPALALVEGGTVAAAAARLWPRRAGVVVAAGTVMLVAEPLAAIVAHDRIAARTDTRVLATRWMAEHMPEGTRAVVFGTHVWVWGVPQFPPNMVGVGADDPSPAGLAAARVDAVVTHDHVIFSSHLDPAVMAALAPHLRLLADFDPFTPGRDDAVFEAADAYYIPFAHFGAVERPGPHIRIYGFEGP